MTQEQANSYAECKTDQERADYIASRDVWASGEFVEVGEAKPPEHSLKIEPHK